MIVPISSDKRYEERIWESHFADDFVIDVVAGLKGEAKSIPSKYLYDALGSALFEAIVLLPEYDLPRNEIAILQEHAPRIVEQVGEPIDLFELGSGSSLKTRLIIEATLARYGTTRYTAVDISREAIRTAATALLDRYPTLSMRALVGDYFQVLPNVRALDNEARPRRMLALCLGSNLGNYRVKVARELLRSLHDALSSGDLLLLGVDLLKDRATMERAYNDPTGVTSAFTKNLLGRIVRELGATIAIENFAHEALFDESTGSIESFLVAQAPATYSLGPERTMITVSAGERIHIEASRKFDVHEIDELAIACGFTPRERMLDERGHYAVVLWERL